MHRFAPRLASLIALSVALSVPELAHAQEGDAAASDEAYIAPVESGSGLRQLYVGAGLGAAVFFDGGAAAFSLEEDVGYRFVVFGLGNGLDGAIFAGLSLGQLFRDRFVVLQFDARGGADLEVWDGGDMQLLVTPSITLGGSVFIVEVPNILTGGSSTQTDGAFDFGFSAQAELTLADGLVGVWLRPLSFEIFVNSGTTATYELLAGAYVRI